MKIERNQEVVQPAAAAPPRKRHRVFLWFFLAVQAVFLVWVIAGASTGSGNAAQGRAQAVQQCSGTGWQGLYSSYPECVTQLSSLYGGASNAGTAVGVGIVISLWVAADVILGVGRIVVVSSRRRSDRA